ncbi:tubulin beta [Fusarium beomiforme]|uniref:Tubulin beta n=1 Tax=Fusarium beomiforme TaxID=44412 RepID=A0A9P5A8P2_9HYPO|nr:tubulin beta [Fusarium beomiforme]
MTLRRFELLQRYLRISDHTNEATDLPRVFQACEEWSLHIQRVSASLFLPGSCLAVDECMIRYTGRSKETTLVKNKPTPHGFKVWAIAQDGFFIHWLWQVKGAKYTAARIQQLEEGKAANGKRKRKGKRASEQLIPLSNTQSVVICLCDTLPTGTYHVFVDNLFSSAALFRALRDRGHGATGTARPNCGLHKDLKRDKERDKNGKSGYKFNEVAQIGWKDNSLVLFLSTVYNGADDQRTDKRRKKPGGRTLRSKPIQQEFGEESSKIISIPTVAAAYNDEMNHVDRGDQLRSYTTYDHRFRRGAWQALAWSFLLDITLINSYLLQKKGNPNWKAYTTPEEWKKCIYNALFNTYGQEARGRKRNCTGKEEDEDDAEAQRKHIDRSINHVNRGTVSDCLACKGFRQGQPRPKRRKRGYLRQISSNARSSHRGGTGRQTRYGCAEASPSFSMGRRAFTNPSKIESESERARNRRRRRQERYQNLARQERLAHPGICVNNSAHNQVLPEDRPCSGLMHNSTTIPWSARQTAPSAPALALNVREEAGCSPSVRVNEHPLSHPTATNSTNGQGLPSLMSQLTETRHDAEQFAAYASASLTLRLRSASQRVTPETYTPRGCTPESTRAYT